MAKVAKRSTKQSTKQITKESTNDNGQKKTLYNHFVNPLTYYYYLFFEIPLSIRIGFVVLIIILLVQ
jgi:hypothetical protein